MGTKTVTSGGTSAAQTATALAASRLIDALIPGSRAAMREYEESRAEALAYGVDVEGILFPDGPELRTRASRSAVRRAKSTPTAVTWSSSSRRFFSARTVTRRRRVGVECSFAQDLAFQAPLARTKT
jgi:hypothetical protein